MKRTLRFTFPDGSVEIMDADRFEAACERQRANVEAARKAVQVEASRLNGAKGGRPRKVGRPSDLDILLRFGDEWLKRMDRLGPRARGKARAELVKSIAADADVDERNVREWLAAVGISAD